LCFFVIFDSALISSSPYDLFDSDKHNDSEDESLLSEETDVVSSIFGGKSLLNKIQKKERIKIKQEKKNILLISWK
jgi:hypothetical protein